MIIDVTNFYRIQKSGEEIEKTVVIPYDDAELSAAEKQQARENIDAITPAAVTSTVTESITTALNRSTPVNQGDTNYTALMARAMSLNDTEVTPTVNGAIAWVYE